MLEKSAEKLRRRLARAPKNARGRRNYDEDLRTAVVELIQEWRDAGLARAKLARALGLHDSTLGYWELGRNRPRRVRPVELAAPAAASRHFTLTLPSGARVDGLEIEDVITLARSAR